MDNTQPTRAPNTLQDYLSRMKEVGRADAFVEAAGYLAKIAEKATNDETRDLLRVAAADFTQRALNITKTMV